MEREQRRLVAILAADVAGYSRLMSADELGTLAQFKLLRQDHIEPALSRHGGRLVGEAGDSLLVEFASTFAAVTCAAEIQEKLAELNAALPERQRMQFRVGVNLGEVILDGTTIHGDGVNVAARLERLAEPGSIVVSRAVHDQVKGKVPYQFEDLGDQHLHNIAQPVKAYRMRLGARAGNAASRLSEPSRPAELATVAVLPFVNIGGDPEQDYFADGITEDIITDLSRWRSLAVASRNSTFRFKGKAVDMQRVGSELGVRYLVEGSVRRLGDRIRITAQLINAETGNHLWGERFDRPLSELFAVQDEVVQTIVGTMVDRVQANWVDRSRRKPPSSLDAYDLVLRGNALSWNDPASFAEATRAFERAIELDPEYGLAHSLLADVSCPSWDDHDLPESREQADRALAMAQRGVELAGDESTCHTLLGLIYLRRRSFDLALRHVERGVELNPANPWNRADLGVVLSYIGRAEEGLELLQRAHRADPYIGPAWYWRERGVAQFVLHRYDAALVDFDRAAMPDTRRVLAMMAGCCAKLGQLERAHELVATCLGRQPGATVDTLVATMPFKNLDDKQHFAECLRLAGFPE
jgi:TolB-like protein/class 3 adenylate cyclase/tetratricopeptide (TPR) repeat protein